MHSGEGLGGSSPKRPRVPWTGGGGGAAASTSSLGRSRCFVVHEVPSTPVAPWDLQNLPLRTVGQGLSPHPSQEGAEPQRSRGRWWGRGSLGVGLWGWGCPCTAAPTPSPWPLQTRAQHCLSLCCPLDVRLLNSTSCPHFIQDPRLLTLAGSLLVQPQLLPLVTALGSRLASLPPGLSLQHGPHSAPWGILLKHDPVHSLFGPKPCDEPSFRSEGIPSRALQPPHNLSPQGPRPLPTPLSLPLLLWLWPP